MSCHPLPVTDDDRIRAAAAALAHAGTIAESDPARSDELVAAAIDWITPVLIAGADR